MVTYYSRKLRYNNLFATIGQFFKAILNNQLLKSSCKDPSKSKSRKVLETALSHLTQIIIQQMIVTKLEALRWIQTGVGTFHPYCAYATLVYFSFSISLFLISHKNYVMFFSLLFLDLQSPKNIAILPRVRYLRKV